MDFQLTNEQVALVESAKRLATERFAEEAFKRDGFAWDSLKLLADTGFTAMTLPTEVGGQGASLFDAVLVLETITKVCPHSGDAMQASNFGAIRQIAAFGSTEVKESVLRGLINGDGLVTAGMSEPGAGSALTELTTRAYYDGETVVINGEKCWNSHGPEATAVVVWCRFGPGPAGIGAVVVPADSPGFTKGTTQKYMSGESHCSLFFDDCRVPASYVLVDSNGLNSLLKNFGIERIGNAARALALAQTAFDRAVEHAKQRHQFGRPLCEFQGIQWKFADMRTKLDAARLLIYRAVVNADAGAPEPVEASIAKAYANEVAFDVANQALQVFGAAGYSTDLPMEYLVRRTRGWMIAGGSVEMMRNAIAQDVFGRRFNQRPESFGA